MGNTGKGFGLLGVGTGSVKLNVNKTQKLKLCNYIDPWSIKCYYFKS